MRNQSKTETTNSEQDRASWTNVFWAMNMLTFAMVLHLWLDHVGSGEGALQLVGFFAFVALVILMHPFLERTYEEFRGVIE